MKLQMWPDQGNMNEVILSLNLPYLLLEVCLLYTSDAADDVSWV